MNSSYIVHHHKTGRPHFDLRLFGNTRLRSWSLLREPPSRWGERRLAIEREELPPETVRRRIIEEEAFGPGRVFIWDQGEVEISEASPQCLVLFFKGKKLSGRYELRHTAWYPGNHWLLEKKE